MSHTLSSADPGAGLNAQDIAQLRHRVDAHLESYFAHHSPESRLACAVRHGLLSPGKRLRPVITLLACKQTGGNIDDVMDAACAVEMVHAASLIMDDLPCMDNARLRRGALTTHVVFGEGAAMLAVISLLNEAFKIISRAEKIPLHARLSAIAHLTDAIGIEGLAGGQDQDLTCTGASAGKSVSLTEMEKRHLEKTGALFSAAAAIGGEFANASPGIIAELIQFGCSLGLAYQAFDDVIDVACSSATTGKDVEQDHEKSTVVSLLGTDGARVLAERRLKSAMEHAENASKSKPSPLADLTRMIGENFGSMTK